MSTITHSEECDVSIPGASREWIDGDEEWCSCDARRGVEFVRLYGYGDGQIGLPVDGD